MSINRDMTPWGQWRNIEGYSLTKSNNSRWGWFWNVTVYRFSLGLDPITFWQPDGTQIRPGQTFETDDGSIPPFLQSIPGLSSNRFEYGYCFHDYGCKYGGLWFKDLTQSEFHFRRLTRYDMDNFLYDWVGADGGNLMLRETIYRGVRIGAAFQKFPSIGYADARRYE